MRSVSGLVLTALLFLTNQYTSLWINAMENRHPNPLLDGGQTGALVATPHAAGRQLTQHWLSEVTGEQRKSPEMVSPNAYTDVRTPVELGYMVEDSLDNPSLGDSSPFGGFTDLRGFGFAVTPFGDDVAGNFTTLGCDLNWWDNAGGTSTRIGFSSNGLFFPRGTELNPGSSSTPFYAPIPTAGGTNSFVAANWDDLVAAPGDVITQSGYVAASAGTCGTPAGRAMIVQLVNAYRYDDESTYFNFQLQHDSLKPDVNITPD